MKRIIAFMLLAAMLCGLAACGGTDVDTANTRTITDGAGSQVQVPEKIQSIVCVGWGALRYSCYMDAADLVIGVEDYETKTDFMRLYNYVNFDKFKYLPVIGTNGQPYAEEIISLSPDVIVMSKYASVDADELQAKTGFYNEGRRIERLAAIKAHWEEILALLAEAPTGEEIAAMLTRAGFTEREYYRTYGSRMIGESIVWAKDLKDRYTLFNMLEDLGVLEAMAGAYVKEYLG